MSNITCAKKRKIALESFSKIAKDRFGDSFGYRLHEFDAKEEDLAKQLENATVITVRSKKTHKQCMVLSFLAPKGSGSQIKYINKKFLPYIQQYQEQLFHEYGEVFLFHEELLKSPKAKPALPAAKEKEICDHFANTLLQLS